MYAAEAPTTCIGDARKPSTSSCAHTRPSYRRRAKKSNRSTTPVRHVQPQGPKKHTRVRWYAQHTATSFGTHQ